MRKCLLTMCLALGGAVIVDRTDAQPKPALAPRSWELTFRFHDPQRVSVFVPGRETPTVYWYMLYTIENTTDDEVDFYPRFDLVTDTLQVVRSENSVSPEAFKAIQRRAGDPLLLEPEKMLGRLLRGKDRARHGVAVWKDFDPEARGFTIYVSGLSGEWTRLRNPAFDPEREEDASNPRYFILRKTLAVPYRLPGGGAFRASAKPQRVPEEQEWVMR